MNPKQNINYDITNPIDKIKNSHELIEKSLPIE